VGALSYKDDIHTVKVGVNYHFNWGGPVVAKY
jgi:outer membrane immunogenic protein